MPAAVSVRTGSRETCTVVGAGDGTSDLAASRFLVYSLTKSMLAAVVLRLAERGEVLLDRGLSRWLPDAPNAARITPRQLLRHTGGLRDYGGVPAYADAVRAGGPPWTDAEYFRRAQATDLLFEPGTGWAYSNIGYLLIRRLIEHVQSESLADTMRSELFAPIGIPAAFVAAGPADLATLRFGASAALDGQSVCLAYHPGWVAHGVAAATASEITAFYAALLEGDLFGSELLAQMREPVPIPLSHRDARRALSQPGYGLGLEIEMDPARPRLIGHSGAGPGSVAAAYHCDGVTVCVLSEGENLIDAEALATHAIRSALPAARHPPVTAANRR